MTPEEALTIIRAEIMAQDWRLSPSRLARLGRALAVHADTAAGRRGFSYLHSMCGGLIAYLERQGEAALPAAVDLLKECLAHLLCLFEGREISRAREAEMFNGAYGRFLKLKDEVRAAAGKKG